MIEGVKDEQSELRKIFKAMSNKMNEIKGSINNIIEQIGDTLGITN
jgi:hypothetical protein